MYRKIAALVLLFISEAANADDLGFETVEVEDSVVEDESSCIPRLEYLRKYGVFSRFHPPEAEYEWVDDFYQVADDKLLFLAFRNDKVFIDWGGYESSKHDHIYRYTVQVIDNVLFYVAVNQGVYHMHYGEIERTFMEPVCGIQATKIRDSIIVVWKDCNADKMKPITWEIPVYEANTDARHR